MNFNFDQMIDYSTIKSSISNINVDIDQFNKNFTFSHVLQFKRLGDICYRKEIEDCWLVLTQDKINGIIASISLEFPEILLFPIDKLFNKDSHPKYLKTNISTILCDHYRSDAKNNMTNDNITNYFDKSTKLTTMLNIIMEEYEIIWGNISDNYSQLDKLLENKLEFVESDFDSCPNIIKYFELESILQDKVISVIKSMIDEWKLEIKFQYKMDLANNLVNNLANNIANKQTYAENVKQILYKKIDDHLPIVYKQILEQVNINDLDISNPDIIKDLVGLCGVSIQMIKINLSIDNICDLIEDIGIINKSI